MNLLMSQVSSIWQLYLFYGAIIGEATSPVIAGYIFDIAGSYNLAFLICAVASVTGLILVLLLKPAHREV